MLGNVARPGWSSKKNKQAGPAWPSKKNSPILPTELFKKHTTKMEAVFTRSVPFFSTITNSLHLILGYASGLQVFIHGISPVCLQHLLILFTFIVLIDILYCSLHLFSPCTVFHKAFRISAFGYSNFTAFQYINW